MTLFLPRFERRNLLRCLTAMTLSLLLGLAPMHAARADMQFDFGGFSIEDERELGEEFNIIIRSSMPMVEDPEITGYVEDITESLLEVMPQLYFEVKTGIIRHNSVNAFAGPGGHLFINSGVILNFEHESELAGVLAHELAHVSQRHLAERMENAQTASLIALAGVLAGMALGSQVGGDNAANLGGGLAVGSMAAAQAAMLSYSRENERDADNVGLNYMIDAGYRPQGLLGAMNNIQRMRWYSGGEIPAYLTTHPDVDERIDYLDARINQLPSELTSRQDDDTRFLKVQTLLRARYTEPETALQYFQSEQADACLGLMGQAIAHDRMSNISLAREHFAQAQECLGDDPLLFREMGRFYFTIGEFGDASYFLQRALVQNPDDLMAMFFLARLLGEQGDQENSALYFKRILRVLPQDPEVHYYYGRVLGEGGELFEAHLHLAYSAVYANDAGQAEYHMDKAERLAESEDDTQAYERLEKAYTKRSEYW
ncbi:MAG: hypothetical protein D6E12_11985 [Desulfovibrio sp.]|nr:MAG: hypothetical protein D6E12_11985 [Desulfovibrio sp.]